MQLSLQHTRISQAARPAVRRALTAGSSNKAVTGRVSLARAPQAAQGSGVETADGASSQETHVVPMADSLLERAKLVVETNHVDEDFADTFVPELEAELAGLRTRAEQAEASATRAESSLLELKDKLVRLQADFDNFRKRSAGEKETMRAAVRGDTVSELLPLVDNFEMAKKSLKLETDGEKRVDAAYQALYKQMVELFRGMGLEATPGVGSPFDPNLHDGIMREASSEVPDGTVLEEFRKGFVLGEKLLRPAMVKVSFREDDAGAADGGEAAAADSSSFSE